jgi:ParB-like chromosome segregation protein Spo0J
MPKPDKTPKTLADLTPDRRNARRRTERSANQLARSLEQFGAARSIVIDEDGRVLAGNGTVEAAAQVGIDRVQVVDVDGDTIVAVRRTGLSEEQKVQLAIADNRTSELAEWDEGVLEELAREVDLSDWFRADELDELLGSVTELEDEEIALPRDQLITCPECGHEFTKGG